MKSKNVTEEMVNGALNAALNRLHAKGTTKQLAAAFSAHCDLSPAFASLSESLNLLIDRLDSDGGPTHEDERDLLGSMVVLKKRLNGDYSFRTENFPKSASASE